MVFRFSWIGSALSRGRFAGVLVWALLVAPLVAQDVGTLKAQARALSQQGDYARAIKVYEQAVANATKEYGANDGRTDILVNELAATYYRQGRYAEAEPLYLRVLKNYEARVGPQDTEVATCLNNLGALYDELGDYARAEATYLRSHRILVAALGANHPDLATNLNNLASVAHNLGDDARSIALYRQSLQLYESREPKDEVLIANSLNNLAAACMTLGQAAEAEPLYQRALKIREARLGANHPSVAVTLNNLAGLHRDQKRYDQAEVFYLRSMKIREAKLGPDHPDVATILNNLASLYLILGKLPEAEKFHTRALEIRQAKLGKDHPALAISLNNLAALYKDLGQNERAEPMYRRSLAIRQARNGNDHPDVAQSFNNLGFLNAKRGEWKAAAGDFDQSRRIVRRHASQVLPALTEAEQLSFLKSTDEHYLHGALSLGLERRDDPGMNDLSAAWVLNSKGIAQQAVSQRVVLARDLADPAIAPGVQKLQTLRRELARLSRTSTKSSDAAQIQKMTELREQEQQTAKQVAETSGRPVQDSLWVELADVRRAVPAGAVLVEMARFRVRDFQAKSGDAQRWQSPHYAAWIVPAANQGDVKLLDLGDAEKVEGAVRDARAALLKSPAAIRSDGEPEAEQQLAVPMTALAQLILHPIVAHLNSVGPRGSTEQGGKVDRLILSPDASLWLVPWAALPLPDKSYAIEKYKLNYVVSGRDVIIHDVQPKLNAPIILADPDYDQGAKESVAAIKALFRGVLPRLLTNVRPAIQLPPVPRLKGTAAEAQAILPKLQSYCGKLPLTYTAENALEGVLKAVRQPQVVVLSTHGFFREDQETGSEEDDRAGSTARRGKPLENPLLRCGLLFAGCNSRELAGVADVDDGVLTGLEVVGIDLRGTELVVLSACETGLGQVRNGEGVAGLRQAFQLAGAQAVLSTLWEIPDVQTARLMSDFFGRLSTADSQGDALRHAQLAMIAARRERQEAAHPFFWAAFTLTGKP